MATPTAVHSGPPIPKRATESLLYKYFSLDHKHEAEHNKRLGWLEKTILTHQLYVPNLVRSPTNPVAYAVVVPALRKEREGWSPLSISLKMTKPGAYDVIP